MPSNKHLSLHAGMAHFLRYIGILILVLAIGQRAGEALDSSLSDAVSCVQMEQVAFQQEESERFTMPQWPCLPDAELAGANGCPQLMGSSRMQRSAVMEYLFFLKERVGELARYEAVRSQYQGKIYESVPSHFCSPVCDYYIFTLRRILI